VDLILWFLRMTRIHEIFLKSIIYKFNTHSTKTLCTKKHKISAVLSGCQQNLESDRDCTSKKQPKYCWNFPRQMANNHMVLCHRYGECVMWVMHFTFAWEFFAYHWSRSSNKLIFVKLHRRIKVESKLISLAYMEIYTK